VCVPNPTTNQLLTAFDLAKRVPTPLPLIPIPRVEVGSIVVCVGRQLPYLKGPDCPCGYDAGLTNQTSLDRFPSPLNFS